MSEILRFPFPPSLLHIIEVIYVLLSLSIIFSGCLETTDYIITVKHYKDEYIIVVSPQTKLTYADIHGNGILVIDKDAGFSISQIKINGKTITDYYILDTYNTESNINITTYKVYVSKCW